MYSLLNVGVDMFIYGMGKYGEIPLREKQRHSDNRWKGASDPMKNMTHQTNFTNTVSNLTERKFLLRSFEFILLY